MMSEVIIDGCNVAECNKYDGNSYIECLSDQTISRKCKSSPDCHFKQLQRLKKENEELKAKINECNDEFGCEQLAKYKQALKEIREIAKHLYYQSIKDPVKREKVIYQIINIINEVLNVDT